MQDGLRSLFEPGLSLKARSRSFWKSTYEIEEVEVDTSRGPLQLVCKHGPPGLDALTGHRRGPPYEATVYEHILPDPALATPVCHGSFDVGGSGVCLVLAQVSGERISHFADPPELVDLSRSLARFHLGAADRLPSAHNLFDHLYFERVVPEIMKLERFPKDLDTSLEEVGQVLVSVPKTAIHGELYPHDVVLGESGPVVLDWESAAAGPGVFDLAVLIQGSWDPDLLTECEETYLELSHEDPATARRWMAAARVWAAALLLAHLRHRESDGLQEEVAVETIGTRLEILRRRDP